MREPSRSTHFLAPLPICKMSHCSVYAVKTTREFADKGLSDGVQSLEMGCDADRAKERPRPVSRVASKEEFILCFCIFCAVKIVRDAVSPLWLKPFPGEKDFRN